MQFKRFFAFGCSWTKWFWPTWADIIARDMDIEYENWGIAGLGNVSIMSRFVEANNKYKFTDSDLIIVQWSGWNREDRFLNLGWACGGSIFNNFNYNEDYIKKYWNFDNDLIKNSVAIKLINDAYGHLIKYQWGMGGDYRHADVNNIRSVADRVPNYNNKNFTVEINPSLFSKYTERIINDYCIHLPPIFEPVHENNRFDGKCMDTHPDVLAHLYIVEKYIYPHIFNNYSGVKSETHNFIKSYHDELAEILSPSDTWDDMEKKIQQVNHKHKLILGMWNGI